MAMTSVSEWRRVSLGRGALLAAIVALTACTGGLDVAEPRSTPRSTEAPAPVRTTATPTTTPVASGSIQQVCSAMVQLQSAGRYSTSSDFSGRSGIFVESPSPDVVRSTLQDFARVAPDGIADTFDAMAASMGSFAALLTADPVVGLSFAIESGDLRRADLQSMDREVLAACGGEVLGTGTSTALDNVSPKRGPNGGAFLRSGPRGPIYGLDSGLCSESIVTTTGHHVKRCGERIVTLDLTTLEPGLILTPADARRIDFGAGGDVAAAVFQEDVPQRGLEPGFTRVFARAYDLTSGAQLWEIDVTPEDPDAADADIYFDMEIAGVTSDGMVALDSPIFYPCGRRIEGFAMVVDRTGTVRWRTEHITGTWGPHFITATGNDRGDCGDDTPYVTRIRVAATGDVIYRGPIRAAAAYEECSAWLQAYRGTYSNDPPNRFVDVATGTQVVSERSLELLLSDGVLLDLRDDGTGFSNASGDEVWTLPEGLSLRNIGGELVATDGSGALIVVDQATGDEQERLSRAPGALLAGGRWQRVEVDGGIVLEPADERWHCTTLDELPARPFDEVEAEVAEANAAAAAAAAANDPELIVRAFVDEMKRAFGDADVEWLVDRLHPGHLDFWTRDECVAAWTNHPEFARFARLTIDGLTEERGVEIDFNDGRILDIGTAYRAALVDTDGSDAGRFTVSLADGGPYWFGWCD